MFLSQLVDALRLRVSSIQPIVDTATQHGQDLQRRGYTVAQVVLDYGDVCQTITEMAVEVDAPISTSDFQILDQCLEEAIASAVTAFEVEHSR